jgi:KDO2-lipid IV(A) lauroyltransferase
MEVEGIKRPPLTPANWPGWLAAGLLWLLGKTPQWLALALSGPLGWLMAKALRRRRHIVARNLERCFPELDEAQRGELLSDFFRSLARMLFEVAWSASASERFLRRVVSVEGLHHAEQALAEGRGVLLLTAHFTCLDLVAHRTGLEFARAGGVYRPLRSPVLEWYQRRARSKWTERLIPKSDLRAAVRFLKSGAILWYAPDQDFGPDRSVFAPFFGIPAATLTVTERLVKLTGCRVVPMFPIYDEETRKYTVRLYSALEDFPSGSEVADLTRINALTEEHVRRAPEQYWWIHRRFKTRPPGEEPFYD